VKTCPSCGRENADDASFCSACGTRLDAAAAREERKVVTCLFCDLVGFTARAESMDPEDVRRLLQPYHSRVRAELERFGGTVEKFIGDAVMAVFGAPVAHEDDPERAVRAALAIRDELAEDGDLQVRIGITTGEALIALDARPAAGEGMASGDVVNTAARLQAAAAPGSILVDEASRRATQNVIQYRAAESVDAKGKAAPVPAWEALLAKLPVGAERLGAAPLVGREPELGMLRVAVERALRERAPHLVTLVGDPGIGKSRLVRELEAIVQAGAFGTVSWLRGRSLPYGQDVSFWAFREIVKTYAGILESDSRAAAEAKLASSVHTLQLGSEADWVQRHLAPVLGLASGEEGADRRPERFAAWRRLLAGMASLQPVVLVFEDLHWADDDLLEFVRSLGEWLSDIPLFALGTARPELLERSPGWGSAERTTAMRLDSLTREATSVLIDELLPVSEIPPDSRRALLEQAGGNPLYAEQYVRMLAERRGEKVVPDTVQALIVARLDALPEAEKRVAQDASVTGAVFWSGSAAAAGGDDRWTAEEHLRALERKALVRRSDESSVAGETEWAFGHALVRDAAYAAIPRARRADKHRRVAGWIEALGRPDDHAEFLAHHYVSALDLATAAGLDTSELSSVALAAVRQAGERAQALHAFTAAARFYRRALELLPADDPTRARLQLELGRSLLFSEAQGDDELLAARDGLSVLGDREGVAEAEILLAELSRISGRRERFEKHVAAVETLAEELSSSPVKTHALLTIATGHNVRGEYERGLDAGRRALALAEELERGEFQVRALNVVGWARAELDEGLDDLERSVELGRSLGVPEVHRSCANLAHQLRHRGEFRRSLELLEEALRLADRFGDAPARRFHRATLAQYRYRQGRWDEALEIIDEYLREVGSEHYHVWLVLATRGLIRLSRGDDGGLEDSIRSVEAARRGVDPVTLPATLEVHARTLALAGRRQEAAEAFEEALGLLESGIVRAGFDVPYLVVTAAEVGEDPERILAVARPSRWKEAAQSYFAGDFVRAADVYAEIGSPTDEAEVRLRAGRSLLESGSRVEAEDQLQKALAFYRSAGAARLVRDAEDLLLQIPA
jgi:class 3 adenylate cyclase/tetratricopeptide (TPR) repeat protein